MFTISRILSAITALLLLGKVQAAPAASTELELDPKCPPGTYSVFESNIWQFDVPAKGFVEKMGSFHNTDCLTSTTGTDNAIGATRTGNYSGSIFAENLAVYSLSASGADLTMGFVQETPGYDVIYEGMVWYSYLEQFSIQSICAGRAAHIVFTAVACVNDAERVYDLYDKVRRVALDAVAAEIGAKLFAGSCKN
ncbi:hypothetical protein H0H81_002099 [Sphagnurus paluster]|uniref:Uncharacterized protein n=1 Tax=Sphagnurus paluster TaxID=117069 RepID=A0A9P7GJQ2_9AGAR|nr:hypothetical protein H0H81_002099 [Sphagnurus paluster]